MIAARWNPLLLRSCALLLCGCAHTAPTIALHAATPPPLAAQPTEYAASAQPPPLPPQNEPITAFMADHARITEFARDAVITGDMESMREPLIALAEYKYATVAPGPWLRWLPQLQATARLTADASTLDAAASGVATMGRICGECHVANGGGPVVQPALPPKRSTRSDTLAKRMDRHMTAADELWKGLTTPSDAAWKAGAATLRYAPTKTHESLPPGFVSRLQEVRQLGAAADEASTLEERSNVYGLLLATCAECHEYGLGHDF